MCFGIIFIPLKLFVPTRIGIKKRSSASSTSIKCLAKICNKVGSTSSYLNKKVIPPSFTRRYLPKALSPHNYQTTTFCVKCHDIRHNPIVDLYNLQAMMKVSRAKDANHGPISTEAFKNIGRSANAIYLWICWH